MEIHEEEIALFAYLSAIPFQSVSCPYMHEGLRSDVRDYLNEMEAKHPGMKNVLLRSSLEVVSRLVRSPEKSASFACKKCGKPTSSSTEICNVCRLKEVVNQHLNYTD
jgi:uncharacterized protein (TIGR00269 family)